MSKGDTLKQDVAAVLRAINSHGHIPPGYTWTVTQLIEGQAIVKDEDTKDWYLTSLGRETLQSLFMEKY